MGLYQPYVRKGLTILGRAEFDVLVRTHQGAVRAFLRRLTRHTALADDLAQMTFLKAYEKRHQMKSLTTARAWVFQIAYTTFVDHVRKESRRRDLTSTAPDVTPLAPETGLSVDIERALAELPDDCRAVIILCLAYGLSHAEAVKITGLPLGTVKSHCTRGKNKLRTFLHAYETANL